MPFDRTTAVTLALSVTAAAACGGADEPAPTPSASRGTPVAAVAGPAGEVDTSGEYRREDTCHSSALLPTVARLTPYLRTSTACTPLRHTDEFLPSAT